MLGGTHWSSRLLAGELGISHSTVARVWAEHDVKPWQTETFKFSTDPRLEARVRDVVGLYLDPPAHAIVLCVDEKSQIQPLERTQPVRPVAPGLPQAGRSHLSTPPAACRARPLRHHKHAKVQTWLTSHPRIHLHFTPTYASWLNLVEVFFAIIERQTLRRGDFASVEEVVAAIRRFCDSWNQRCRPFTWTKNADQILTKLKRQTLQQHTPGPLKAQVRS